MSLRPNGLWAKGGGTEIAGEYRPGAFHPVSVADFQGSFHRQRRRDVHSLFSLIFTYYFRVHFPQSGRLWFIFILGLLEDFLSGGYLGLTTLILLLISALFERQRKIFLQGSFMAEIFIFLFFSLAVSVLYWILTSFIEAQFIPGLPFFIQGLITALVFPLYVFLIGRINKRFSR